MRIRVIALLLASLTSAGLTGCASTSEPKPRPGVLEAQACQRTLERDPARLTGYIIRACTNTGVWVVDQVDPDLGTTTAHYDFVNNDYSGPETGYSVVSVESLGEDLITSYRALRLNLNRDLKKTL